jgi:molybdenum cofactor biosynthesis protein B
MSRIDDNREFIPINIAVLTVSDSRTLAEDRSGDILAGRLTEAGHKLAARAIVIDERDRIAAQLREWIADPGIDVIISTGGTGLTGRDITVEAHRDVYEKEIEAFNTYLFALPGSPGACKDGWDEILKWQLDYRHMPCNFVEIMPRLEEHKRRK